MSVDAASFRAVLGQWPSGVTVVTTVRDEPVDAADATAGTHSVWHGMTASSFSSVSLDPPLVSVCLDKRIWTHDLIAAAGRFAVNILGKDQADVGKRFAGMLGDEPSSRFEGLAAATAATGAPVLTDALGWVDCEVRYAYPGGDHTIFVGEVLAADVPRLRSPLLFHSRAWGQFADQLPEAATVVDAGLAAALRARGIGADRRAASLTAVRATGAAVRVLDLSAEPLPTEPLPEATGAAWAYVATAEDLRAAAALGIGGADVALAEGAEKLVAVAREAGVAVRVEVAAAFDPAGQDALGPRLAAAIALAPDSVVLVDDGTATPLTVRAVLQEAVPLARPVPIAVRLSDHAGLGAAHALTALKSGAQALDGTLGGLDGAFALEDALNLLEQLEVLTPVARPAAVAAARDLEHLLGGDPLPGRTYRLPAPAVTHGGDGA